MNIHVPDIYQSPCYYAVKYSKLNLCIQTELVTVRADATATYTYVWFLTQI